MTWVKLDDAFAHHPKVLKAGPLAAWLYVCGLTYSAKHLTDGYLPDAALRLLADIDDPAPIAERLCSTGLWEQVDGGYQIHDYLHYQPSAEQVKRERERNAERQAEWRRQRNAGSNAVTNSITNEGSNAVTNAAPARPVPVPARPDPIETPEIHEAAVPGLAKSRARARPAAALTPEQQIRVDEINRILAPLGLSEMPAFWAKVLDKYGELDLGEEALKAADWLRRHKKRQCSGGFFLNWLKRANEDANDRGNGHRTADNRTEPYSQRRHA